MCQLHALAAMQPGKFELLKLADAYRLWMKSDPFSMGVTTSQGLGYLLKEEIPCEYLIQ